MYIDKLDDINKEYNNTYHTSIKVKPVDVKDNTYIDFEKEVNDKNPKFKVGDHVEFLSKYKNTFANGYVKLVRRNIHYYIHLVEILMLRLICLIMQQRQILKIFHMLILQVLH